MAVRNIPGVVTDYDSETETIQQIATSGFVLAFNYTFRGPEFFDSTYPPEWQAEYEAKGYYFKDPILLWSVAFSGNKRWSEVPLPDLGNVMERAGEFGLNYGATFSRLHRRNRSILTVSRPDREIDDREMTYLSNKFDRLVSLVSGECGLTEKEKDVLVGLNEGLNLNEIGDDLSISLPAVKARIKSARMKLDCATTTQAVALAVKRNYI